MADMIPPSDKKERPELDALVKESVERFNKLSPVERAIASLQQRRSFLRGGLDETSAEHVDAYLDKEPEYVLLAAYREAMDLIAVLEMRGKTDVERIAELEAALTPFADIGGFEIADRWLRPDNKVIWNGDFRGPFQAYHITYGDLRRADAALSKSKEAHQ